MSFNPAEAASLMLAGRLPDYLVPGGFKAVVRIPLNANGKVDRAALPAPERDAEGPVTPPQGPTEERLADVWRRLAERTGVGVLEFYASTEGTLVLANAAGEKVGALGRPLPGARRVRVPHRVHSMGAYDRI